MQELVSLGAIIKVGSSRNGGSGTLACLAIAGSMLTTGCSQPHIGEGPIRFSPGLQAYYQQYLDEGIPGAFAVSEDGAASYVYCRTKAGCRGSLVGAALANCRKRARKPCYIYDIGGRVVWRNADAEVPADLARGEAEPAPGRSVEPEAQADPAPPARQAPRGQRLDNLSL